MPLKLNVFFAFFPYGGNGGISSEHPSIRKWFTATMMAAKNDPRVGDVFSEDFSDTPITMTRNKAVVTARKHGADVLVMCDSDQQPDLMLGKDPLAKPFWNSSFDFLYKHWTSGPCVVGAPYCGPPPCENVYIFRWATSESSHPNLDFRLEQYPREEATILSGIHPAAALPTGLIMFDMRCFDLVKPPYFYYEYTDEYETDKASTEDVTATRDISLSGNILHGVPTVYVNWDAWAGHWKPKCVGKPTVLSSYDVSKKFVHAVASKAESPSERMINVSPNGFDESMMLKSVQGTTSMED